MRIIVPGGISALFEPFIVPDPYLCGARGAGIGIENAAIIELNIRESDSLSITNVINGKHIRGGIGEEAVRAFFEVLGIEPKYSVEIRQEIKVPIGAGFGTSAASALGIIILLSYSLDVPLTLVEAGDIAHIAEIRARSGLGTVSGLVFLGDIVIVSKPGAPSHCLIDRIPLPLDDIYVVLASKGKVETAKALADEKLLERAKTFGKIAVDNLIKKPTLKNFFRTAKFFAEKTGLITKEIFTLIRKLENTAIGSAQAMIGDSIFALAYRDDVEEVKKIIEETMKTEAIVLKPVRSGFCLHFPVKCAKSC